MELGFDLLDLSQGYRLKLDFNYAQLKGYSLTEPN